jgi:Tol biopolymer transport system component
MPTKPYPTNRTGKANSRRRLKTVDKKWVIAFVVMPILLAVIGLISTNWDNIVGRSNSSSIVSTPQPQITPFANVSGGKIFFLQNNNFYMTSLDKAYQTLIVQNPQAYITCPSVSPDGEKLLFTSNVEGHADIYTINRDGSGLVNVTNSIGYDEVCGSWSPDMKHILFYRQYSISSDILLIGSDGTDETNLTNIFKSSQNIMNTIAEMPWSPDGTKFVFQSNRGDDFSIYIYDLITGQTNQVTNSPKDEYKATWSPDGTKIVYTGVIEGEDYDIFVLDLNWPLPTTGINITNNPAHETDATWSPDSTQIAFISDRDGNDEIYIISSSRRGLNMVYLVLAKETKSHVQAHKQDYSKNSI